MNLSLKLSPKELETLTKNSLKSKTLRRKVISNQNKSKRSTEKLNTNNKEANLKVSLTSSGKPMLRTLSNTETFNSKNSTMLPTPSSSQKETPTLKKLINSLSWPMLLLKISLWLKAPKISLKFWKKLPAMPNLKNLLRPLLLKIKLFNQLRQKLNNQSKKHQLKRSRSRNQSQSSQLLFQNQKLLFHQSNKPQLFHQLNKPQLLPKKPQLSKKPNNLLKKLNKSQLLRELKSKLKEPEPEVQESTEDLENTEDQENKEVQENTENQRVRDKREKEEDTTTPTGKDPTTNQRIKNKSNKSLILILHSRRKPHWETSTREKSDSSKMKDSKLLESQSQRPKKDKRNGTKELTEEKPITTTNTKTDQMYI